MRYAFELHSREESIYHQKFFFKKGFLWNNGSHNLLDRDIQYLIIDTNRGVMLYSDVNNLDSVAIKSKLLHPNQMKFLKIQSYDRSEIVQRAIRRGFYELEDSTYLNNLLMDFRHRHGILTKD